MLKHIKKQANVDGFLFGDYDEILEDDDGLRRLEQKD